MQITDSAFEKFAVLHPIEAFDLSPENFCNIFRNNTGKDITDEQIKEFVDSMRD